MNKCPNCEQEIKDDYNFCPYCGEALTDLAKVNVTETARFEQMKILSGLSKVVKDKDTLTLIAKLSKDL